MYKRQAITGGNLPKEAQLLSGIGSSAWFHYVKKEQDGIVISRYNEQQLLDFQGVFTIPEGFDPTQTFSFDYDCNCSFCYVLQGGERYKITLVREVKPEISSSQMVHSA